MGLSASLGGIFTPLLGLLADAYGITSVIYALAVIGALCAMSAFLLTEPAAPKANK